MAIRSSTILGVNPKEACPTLVGDPVGLAREILAAKGTELFGSPTHRAGIVRAMYTRIGSTPTITIGTIPLVTIGTTMTVISGTTAIVIYGKTLAITSARANDHHGHGADHDRG